MARKPEVFVRALSNEEGQRLVRITRTTTNRVRLRRAMIVLASAQGQSVPQIAHLTQGDEGYIRQVIKDFNAHGFEALNPKWSGGRPKKITGKIASRICRAALARPHKLGLPFTTWSLRKLRDHLIEEGIVESIAVETLRRVLAERGITFQRTKTWKASPDPDFEAKMWRILDLYDDPPADGRVICVDEFGPLNLQPRGGMGWYRIKRPVRLRATYTRTAGVRQMFAALDLATGKMIWRTRNRWIEFLASRVLRERFDERLYLVVDNYSPHRRREVGEWCDDNDVELVFLPTYSSWLNRIEPEFTALRYFVLNGADYASHTEQTKAIGDYLRWRNRRAEPIREFAVNSNIRQLPRPDYLDNVACHGTSDWCRYGRRAPAQSCFEETTGESSCSRMSGRR
jgi:transposase